MVIAQHSSCRMHTINVTVLPRCCCSVTKLCPTLCDLMDCSTPGFPVSPSPNQDTATTGTSSWLSILPYVCAKSLQLCPTLCDPVDHSPSGFSLRGVLQVRVLEWVAMPSSREYSPKPCLNDKDQVFFCCSDSCSFLVVLRLTNPFLTLTLSPSHPLN